MTPEYQRWLILKKIMEAVALKKGDNFELSMTTFPGEAQIDQVVAVSVLDGLQARGALRYAKENEQITITVTDSEALSETASRAHADCFGSLPMLSKYNFLALIDVVADIQQELEVATDDEIEIHALPGIIRFSDLCPVQTPDALNRYLDLREKAARSLVKHGAVKEFAPEVDGHPWGASFVFKIDRVAFDHFRELLSEMQKRRLVEQAPTEGAAENIKVKSISFDGFALRVNEGFPDFVMLVFVKKGGQLTAQGKIIQALWATRRIEEDGNVTTPGDYQLLTTLAGKNDTRAVLKTIERLNNELIKACLGDIAVRRDGGSVGLVVKKTKN
jgi:hypothetical protein